MNLRQRLLPRFPTTYLEACLRFAGDAMMNAASVQGKTTPPLATSESGRLGSTLQSLNPRCLVGAHHLIYERRICLSI